MQPAPPDFSPKFPEVVDSTMLNEFRSCPQAFYLSYIRRIKGATSIHLHAGGAYAAGLEATRTHYLLHGDAETAIIHGLKALWRAYGNVEPPEGKEYKGPERITEAFVKYFERWPLEKDTFQLLHINGKPGVEFSFSVPLPIEHPVTGNPIMFAGRLDWIGTFNGALFLVDEKTATYFGKDWASDWALRAQFMAYCWAARTFGFDVIGALVRGVALKPATGPEFCEAGPILFPEWKLNRWYDQTLMDVSRMVKCWLNKWWDWNYGTSCTNYGGCFFQDLCRTRNIEPWLTPDRYQENTWSPLRKEEE